MPARACLMLLVMVFASTSWTAWAATPDPTHPASGAKTIDRRDLNGDGVVDNVDARLRARMLLDKMRELESSRLGRASASVSAFTINIDASALPSSMIRVVGCGVNACFSSQQVQVLSLDTGPFSFQLCNGVCGSSPALAFDVVPDGTVSYSAALAPYLSGAGTSTLIVTALVALRLTLKRFLAFRCKVCAAKESDSPMPPRQWPVVD